MKKNISDERKRENRKLAVIFSLMFAGIVLAVTGNVVLSKKMQDSEKEKQVKLSSNFEFVSALATSDVNMETNGKKISYFVDLDFNNDGVTDKTIALVDNVKYVSGNRLAKMSKVKKGSKLVFECNLDTHLKVYPIEEKTYPEIVVDLISGTSAVGLVDNLVVINGEIVADARKENNKEFLDYLDGVLPGEKSLALKDKKIDNEIFERFYDTNLKAR